MKKLKVIIVAALVMAVPLLALVSTTHAGDFRSGANTVIGKGEVIDHTLFIVGNNVEINGTVNGDVFCAGENVTITAKVSGDVLCAGMNVRVDGDIDGDVRVAGQVVTLAATVAGSASLAGSTVTTEEASKVGGDLQAAGSLLTMNGQVARDATIGGETVVVNSMLGRNVTAASEDLTLGERAVVKGDVTYYSNNKLHQAGRAQVTGKVMQEKPTQDHHESTNPFAAAFAGGIMFLIMMLVLALAVAALFPRMVHTVSDNAVSRPGMTALIGLAACIAVPVLIIGSFLTIVGVLLGVTLLLFWMVMMLLSGVFFSYYLGRLVFRRTVQHPLLVMFVGVLLMTLLLMIPLINILAVVAATLFGSGMIVRELFTRTPKPAYEVAASTSKTKKKL